MKLSRAAIGMGVVLAAGYWKRWEAGELIMDGIYPTAGGDVDTLARTLWGEARGEGRQGMQAVANVIMNRVRIGGWWGNTVEAVCRKPWQFSCWLATDPNSAKMRTVTPDDAAFRTALELAQIAVTGKLSDITGGATHYHAKHVSPAWAVGATLTKIIGNHIFYRGVG